MIEWFSALFFITGAWVWVWSAVVFVLILILSEHEYNWWSFAIVVGFIAVMQHSGVVSLFEHPLKTVLFFGLYFAIGSGWSLIKWFSFLHHRADDFAREKLDWLDTRNRKVKHYQENLPTSRCTADREEIDAVLAKTPLSVDIKTKIPEDEIKHFNSHLKSSYYNYNTKRYDFDENTLAGVIPSAYKHKEKIVTWILWWPTSALWTLVNDPLVRLATFIYNRFQGLYKKMANRVFAKFDV